MRQLKWSYGVVLLVLAFGGGTAFAHSERKIQSPVRPGPLPDINRVNPKRIVVCKPSSKPTAAQLADIQHRVATTTGADLEQAKKEEAAWHRNSALFTECCTEHIQTAVNGATDGTDILILPGIYREEPSRAAPTTGRGDNPDGTYSYEYHVAHPNDANLIFLGGKTNITLEGTGARPEDVVIDVGFTKDVGIRADRVQGFIARNFLEKDANEHGVYTVDSDGYIYDRLIGSFNKEYELFAFASDNGLMTDCEVIGGGDSGFYIGGAPDTHTLGRYSQTIRRSKMHHNVLGFSGTQGTSVLITECDVFDNAIGISFDTENDHPNVPQRFAVLENNDIHDNNFDIYAATADVPTVGIGYNTLRLPVGTGISFFGANDNIVRNNRIYNNGRIGILLSSNPLENAAINRNQFINNQMGTAAGNGAGPNGFLFPAGGKYKPGGSDFFWDETGNDNCWGPNQPDDTLKTDPDPIPGPCAAPNLGKTTAPPRKLVLLINCTLEEIPDSNPRNFQTVDMTYPCPWGHLNLAPYENRDEMECENGAIDPGEDCDQGGEGGEANLNGQSCSSLGLGSGTLSCNPFCQFDTSGCSTQPSTATQPVCAPRPVPAVASSGFTITENGDGCAIVRGASSSRLLVLMIPAVVLLWRRSQRRR